MRLSPDKRIPSEARAYIKAVKAIEPPPWEEQLALFEQYVAAGRPHGSKMEQKLVEYNLRYALSYVVNWKRKARLGFPFNDAIQAANEGLLIAVRKFDPKRGVRFVTCAIWWVRVYVYKEVKTNISIVKFSYTAHRKLEDVPKTFSLNTPLSDEDGDESATFQDELTDGSESVDQKMIESLPSHYLRWAIRKCLKPRERYVIEQRMYYGSTLEDVGKNMGVSRERVRQMELQIKEKLKRIIERKQEAA